MLFLLLSVLHADELRWLEDPDHPAVVAWQSERTERALDWLDRDRIDRLTTLIEDRRLSAWDRVMAADHVDGTTVWYQRTMVEFTEEERQALEPGDPRKGIVHSEVFVQRAGEAWPGMPLTAPGIDSEWGVCRTTLDPSASTVLWGRSPPIGDPRDFEPPHRCHVFVTDLDTAVPRALGEHLGWGGAFSPDSSSLLMAAFEGRRSTVWTQHLDDDQPSAPLLRSKSRISVGWLPDGDIIARTSFRLGKSTYKHQRFAWGDPPTWLHVPPNRYDLVGELDDHRALFLVGVKERQLVIIDLDNPGREHWKEVMADTDTVRIRHARLHGDTMLMALHEDGATGWYEQTRDGPRRRVFPQNFQSITATRTRGDTALIRGYTAEGAMVWLRSLDGTYTELQGEHLAPGRLAETVHAPSADGTPIPLSVVRPAEIDGPRPVWIRTYGGFGAASTTRVRQADRLFLDMGGIVVTVHARGGNERGDDWHEQAQREHIGRTFEDVIGAAEWLIDQGWTEPGRIAVSGTSNGGLTATASMAARPELFGAVITTAGVHDLLRGDAMGVWWRQEYGSPKDPRQRKILARWSPVETRPQPLPPVLIVTGHEDPTVTPSHAYKLAAAWEDLDGGPVLLRVLDWPTHVHHFPPARAKTVRDDLPDDAFSRQQAEQVAFLMGALDLWLPED